jgi:hypothetical protein
VSDPRLVLEKETHRRGKEMYAIANGMAGVRTGFTVIGCVVAVYFAVRLLATSVDVFQRWRRSRAGDPNAWD